MGDTQTTAPEAPGAETAEAAPKAKSGRAKRYSFYPDGLDYVILGVEQDPETGAAVPNGKLSAVPGEREVNGEKIGLRFETAQEAKRWIQASGEKLQGQTVIVARMMHKLHIAVENKPRITVTEGQRFEKEVGS